MRFKNRVEAGQKLAQKLAHYKDKDVIVYTIPRGGIVLGYEIAIYLNAPLDLVITRKIGHPYNPEYAVCVIAEDGHMVCNEEERNTLDEAWLKKAAEKERQEAHRRREVYLKGRKELNPQNKIAIIVDDGVATGLTFLLAIDELKHRNPQKIIAAIPVAPQRTAQKIKQKVDELIALEIPEVYLGSVGAYYDEFPQIQDKEVIKLLEKVK